ncbi:MAG TPA: TGS domain-containing protein, partial [Dehalococcoidia bacterium]|nr:TGS domain-containing protein [Dehalococcoidia bacterium]
EEKIAWLRQLLEWRQELSGAREFVETVKTDVFRDRVFVYTPKGEIKDLPSGSTPLDFAYRVHTAVGHRCIGAKVNGRLVALNTPLQNGDIVEILTAKNAKGPSRDWLNPNLGYVATSHAREKIRQWFKRQERAQNIVRGRDLLDRELRRLGLSATDDEILKAVKFDNMDDLLAAIAYGEIGTQQIALRLSPPEEPRPLPTVPATRDPVTSPGSIQVMGVGDLLTQLARCCNPVPGDEIIGYVTRSRGVSIHRLTCPNITRDRENDPDRLVSVDWGRAKGALYPVAVRLEAHDRVGLLADVTNVIAQERVNMTSAHTETGNHRATMRLTLEINGVGQLSRVLGRLEGVRGVINVQRDEGHGR